MAKRQQYSVSRRFKDFLRDLLGTSDSNSINALARSAFQSRIGLGAAPIIDGGLLEDPFFPGLGLDEDPSAEIELVLRPQDGVHAKVSQIANVRKRKREEVVKQSSTSKKFSAKSQGRVVQEVIRRFLLLRRHSHKLTEDHILFLQGEELGRPQYKDVLPDIEDYDGGVGDDDGDDQDTGGEGGKNPGGINELPTGEYPSEGRLPDPPLDGDDEDDDADAEGEPPDEPSDPKPKPKQPKQ